MTAEGVQNWRAISDGVCAFHATGSFAESMRLSESISRIDGVATVGGRG